MIGMMGYRYLSSCAQSLLGWNTGDTRWCGLYVKLVLVSRRTRVPAPLAERTMVTSGERTDSLHARVYACTMLTGNSPNTNCHTSKSDNAQQACAILHIRTVAALPVSYVYPRGDRYPTLPAGRVQCIQGWRSIYPRV